MKEENGLGALRSMTPTQRKLSIIGCILITAALGSNNAVSISMTQLLTRMDALSIFAFTTVIGTTGMAIMTPIGGKLGDILGRRNLVIICSLMFLIGNIGIGYVRNQVIFMICLLISGVARGAMVSVPAVVIRLIAKSEDVPKYLGMTSTGLSLGTFLGGFVAGILTDMGHMGIGVVLAAVPAILGAVCFYFGMPNIKNIQKAKFDSLGSVLLAIVICTFVISFSFASRLGWTNPLIIALFVLLIVSMTGFVFYEKNYEAQGGAPIISVRFFKNKEFSLLLFIGFICYFPLVPIANYGAIAAINVLGQSSTITSTLTLPRTILTTLLPTFTGIWVGRNKNNYWKAFAIATGLLAIAFLPLSKVTSGTAIIIFFIAFSISGIAESFRAVSITPCAQELLEPKDLASGTALINFMNTLSMVVSSAISASLYNSSTDMAVGVSRVFMFVVILSVVGFILVITLERSFQLARTKK